MRRFVLTATNEIQRLYRFVRWRINDIQDAEDVLQDTMLALLEKWHLGVAIEDPLSWLYGTARNKIVDWYRRKARGPVAVRSDTDAGDLWDLAEAEVATPDEQAQREELRQALLRALDRLPEEQRDVFLHTELDGLSYKAIHARTGLPINTLLSRKRYAVLRLRTALAEWLEPGKET